jgi:hypothetical protein
MRDVAELLAMATEWMVRNPAQTALMIASVVLAVLAAV